LRLGPPFPTLYWLATPIGHVGLLSALTVALQITPYEHEVGPS
jgi:hypothetical protein